MANALTGFRIVCSVSLLFLPTYSASLYLLYIVAGITDMLDGFVARKRNEDSKFGAIFDSAADCIFVGACMIKLLPLYDVSLWLYVWIAAIALIRLFNIVLGFVIHKAFLAEHTLMNKITGMLLFLFPLVIRVVPFQSGAMVLCVIASFSAIQETHYIKKGNETENKEGKP